MAIRIFNLIRNPSFETNANLPIAIGINSISRTGFGNAVSHGAWALNVLTEVNVPARLQFPTVPGTLAEGQYVAAAARIRLSSGGVRFFRIRLLYYNATGGYLGEAVDIWRQASGSPQVHVSNDYRFVATTPAPEGADRAQLRIDFAASGTGNNVPEATLFHLDSTMLLVRDTAAEALADVQQYVDGSFGRVTLASGLTQLYWDGAAHDSLTYGRQGIDLQPKFRVEVQPPEGDWMDVTERVESVGVKRGRNVELDEFAAGTAQLTLSNDDGVLDPIGRNDAPLVEAFKQFGERKEFKPFRYEFPGVAGDEGYRLEARTREPYAWRATSPAIPNYRQGSVELLATGTSGTPGVQGVASGFHLLYWEPTETDDSWIPVGRVKAGMPWSVSVELDPISTTDTQGKGALVQLFFDYRGDSPGVKSEFSQQSYTVGLGRQVKTFSGVFDRDATEYQFSVNVQSFGVEPARLGQPIIRVSPITIRIGEGIGTIARPGSQVRIFAEDHQIGTASVERWRSDLLSNGTVTAELVDATDVLAGTTVDDGDYFVYTAAKPYAFLPLDEGDEARVDPENPGPIVTDSFSVVNDSHRATWTYYGIPDALPRYGLEQDARFGAPSILPSGRGSSWTTGLGVGRINNGLTGSNFRAATTGAVLFLEDSDGQPLPSLPLHRRAWGLSFAFRAIGTFTPVDSGTGNQSSGYVFTAMSEDDQFSIFMLYDIEGAGGIGSLSVGIRHEYSNAYFVQQVYTGGMDSNTHYVGILTDPISSRILIRFDDAMFTLNLGSASETWRNYESVLAPRNFVFGGAVNYGRLSFPTMMRVQNVGLYLWEPGTEPNADWLISTWQRDYFTAPGQDEVVRSSRLLEVASRGTRTLQADEGLTALSRDSVGSGSDVMTQVRDYVRSAGGSVFVNGAGDLVYHNRYRRAEFIDPIILSADDLSSNVEIESDQEDIVNAVDLDVKFGIKARVQNRRSIARHGERSMTLGLSVANETEGFDAARDFLKRYAEPQPRVTSLSIRLSADSTFGLSDTWLGVEPGQPVRLVDIPNRGPMNLFVESIEYVVDIEGEKPVVTLTMALSPALTGPVWRLGESTLGTDTVVVY